jgi:hypothetical protein
LFYKASPFFYSQHFPHPSIIKCCTWKDGMTIM